MAVAKKCDRCGVYYDDNAVHKPKTMSKEYHIGVIKTAIAEGMTPVDEAFDLCDGCIELFFQFMNEYKETEK